MRVTVLPKAAIWARIALSRRGAFRPFRAALGGVSSGFSTRKANLRRLFSGACAVAGAGPGNSTAVRGLGRTAGAVCLRERGLSGLVGGLRCPSLGVRSGGGTWPLRLGRKSGCQRALYKKYRKSPSDRRSAPLGDGMWGRDFPSGVSGALSGAGRSVVPRGHPNARLGRNSTRNWGVRRPGSGLWGGAGPAQASPRPWSDLCQAHPVPCGAPILADPSPQDPMLSAPRHGTGG